MNTIADKLTLLRGVTRTAFDRMNVLAGRETDKELLTYGKLVAEDFDTLAKKFGVGPVADYIKNMEHLKMTRKAEQNG